MFYLAMHSTHFIYSYMASDIWLRTILIVRKETCCRHIGYSFRLTARVLLYAPSHRQDNTYHSICYTSRRALAGTRNSSMGPPHEDRSDDHERTLLPQSYISLLIWCNATLKFLTSVLLIKVLNRAVLHNVCIKNHNSFHTNSIVLNAKGRAFFLTDTLCKKKENI